MVHLCIFVMDFVTKIKKAQLYELFDDRGDRIRTTLAQKNIERKGFSALHLSFVLKFVLKSLR